MEPLVSVLCLAYNHEAYIRRTLDSFLSQQTDFPFEIIIHDDASTDGTAAVIREYAERYPEIVKPILQTENQYSKPDTPIMKTFVYPAARGKYFAMCDGDDQFTDPSKLQRQADFLEAHPEYSMVLHRARLHREGEDPSSDRLYPEDGEDRDFSAEEIAVHGAGRFATNSFMFRREICETLPDCFFISGVGDYPWLFYGVLSGKCRYLARPMCVHNEGVTGSWTVETWGDTKAHIEHEHVIMDMLRKVDAYYDGRWHDIIEKALTFRREELAEYVFTVSVERGDWETARSGDCRPYYLAWKKQKRRERLKARFPFLLKIKHVLEGKGNDGR